MTYTYRQTEPSLWTVFDGSGEPVEDFASIVDARTDANRRNGIATARDIDELEAHVLTLIRQMNICLNGLVSLRERVAKLEGKEQTV